jgi:histidine ammonia-lyase
MRIDEAGELDRAAVAAIARDGREVVLGDGLLGRLAESREATLRDLGSGAPVYGVNTGMGALSGIRLDAEAQARHQDGLMVGRAAGSAPWLRREQARAVLAVRLRGFLSPAAGVSPELCVRLTELLNADVVPAIPARGSGAAGEIIPLAHAGAALLGTGHVLAPGGVRDAGEALREAGLPATGFGPKEGVAFLQGVPGLTGMAILAAEEAAVLVRQSLGATAGSMDVVRASNDTLHSGLADGADTRTVMAALKGLRGEVTTGRLQAPVSFRVSVAGLAVALRAVTAMQDAADRSLAAVTDSPAHLDGRFVGGAGFSGTDLVAAAQALTVALVHLAELGAARLHRMLDPALTGLTPQLAGEPGLDAGMAAVHKRAVGVVHRLRRYAMPSLGGSMETSLGQEDVQSFGFEAAECLGEAIEGLRDVTACELLAVHQAGRHLIPDLPRSRDDRPWGRDLDLIVALLTHDWDVPGGGMIGTHV